MTDETDPGEEERPFGAEWVDGFVAMLDQHGTWMLPRAVAVSPEDAIELDRARAIALELLSGLGWTAMLPELRRRLADWVLYRFQAAQFRAMYFGGWSSRPADRATGFAALEDLALAVLLHDRLEPSLYDRLVGRWEVGTGAEWRRPGEP